MRVHRVLLARVSLLHSAVVVRRVDGVAVRRVVFASEVLLWDSKRFPFRILLFWHTIYCLHIVLLNLLHKLFESHFGFDGRGMLLVRNARDPMRVLLALLTQMEVGSIHVLPLNFFVWFTLLFELEILRELRRML